MLDLLSSDEEQENGQEPLQAKSCNATNHTSNMASTCALLSNSSGQLPNSPLVACTKYTLTSPEPCCQLTIPVTTAEHTSQDIQTLEISSQPCVSDSEVTDIGLSPPSTVKSSHNTAHSFTVVNYTKSSPLLATESSNETPKSGSDNLLSPSSDPISQLACSPQNSAAQMNSETSDNYTLTELLPSSQLLSPSPSFGLSGHKFVDTSYNDHSGSIAVSAHPALQANCSTTQGSDVMQLSFSQVNTCTSANNISNGSSVTVKDTVDLPPHALDDIHYDDDFEGQSDAEKSLALNRAYQVGLILSQKSSFLLMLLYF